MSDESPFRLVRRDHESDPEESRGRLMRRGGSGFLLSHEASARQYVLSAGLETAVNMALAVREPLLVTGGPGTGKTQLAYYLGAYFGISVRTFHVKSTSTARDLKWDFDAVGYLQSAYAATHNVELKRREDFLEPGPLWQAYEDERPSVLLIDEIDKAPRDFPNDLLHEIDQGWFFHPFTRDASGNQVRIPRPGLDQQPIIIITSNEERQLPTAFLRRCVFHYIELTPQLVETVLGARVNAGAFRTLSPEIRQVAVERFWDIRDAGYGLAKPPATGELLVWLALLDARGVGERELRAPISDLPCLGALVKDHDDLARLRR